MESRRPGFPAAPPPCSAREGRWAAGCPGAAPLPQSTTTGPGSWAGALPGSYATPSTPSTCLRLPRLHFTMLRDRRRPPVECEREGAGGCAIAVGSPASAAPRQGICRPSADAGSAEAEAQGRRRSPLPDPVPSPGLTARTQRTEVLTLSLALPRTDTARAAPPLHRSSAPPMLPARRFQPALQARRA